MKFKGIFLIGIFAIAILLIGSVSAYDLNQENIDAVSDIQSKDDLILTENPNGKELSDLNQNCNLDTGLDTNSINPSNDIQTKKSANLKDYYDDDFYITIKENYSEDKECWNSTDFIYISSSSNKTGNLKVLVNNSEKLSVPITDGYFAIEDNGYGEYKRYYNYVYPTDLALDVGQYDIKINFDDGKSTMTLTSQSASLKEKDDFDIYLLNPYYSEKDYWDSALLLTIDSNHFNNGTLDIYVDNQKKLSYAVENGCFEYDPTTSNRSRYIYPSNLGFDYGTYDIKITFSQDGKEITLKEESLNLSKYPPSEAKIQLYFDLYDEYWPADNRALIYLPYDANGTLSLSVNGKVADSNISYENGYAAYVLRVWNLNLGENLIEASYNGEDYGKLNDSKIIRVIPSLDAPAYVSIGETFNMSIRTHEWSIGTFNLYSYTGNPYSEEGIRKGELIASTSISQGLASLALSSNKLGLNKYFLEYLTSTGYCNSTWDIELINNSKNINVTIPDAIMPNETLSIRINAPESLSYVYILIDNGASEYFSMETGELIRNLSLSGGKHLISVKWDNRYYDDDFNYVGDIYSNTFTVNVGYPTKMDASNLSIVYSDSASMAVILKDIAGNPLINKIIYYQMESDNGSLITDSNGKALLSLGNLKAGNHTVFFSFDGDKDYLASNAGGSVIVKRANSAFNYTNLNTVAFDSMIDGRVGDYFSFQLIDGDGKPIADKQVFIGFNGVKYNRTTNETGGAKLQINLKYANYYTFAIAFLGDDCYSGSFNVALINVTEQTPSLSASSKTYKSSAKAKILTATLKSSRGHVLAGKRISFSLNGKTYTANTNSQGMASVNVSLSKKGTYGFTVEYAGDSTYKKTIVSSKLTIK